MYKTFNSLSRTCVLYAIRFYHIGTITSLFLFNLTVFLAANHQPFIFVFGPIQPSVFAYSMWFGRQSSVRIVWLQQVVTRERPTRVYNRAFLHHRICGVSVRKTRLIPMCCDDRIAQTVYIIKIIVIVTYLTQLPSYNKPGGSRSGLGIEFDPQEIRNLTSRKLEI